MILHRKSVKFNILCSNEHWSLELKNEFIFGSKREAGPARANAQQPEMAAVPLPAHRVESMVRGRTELATAKRRRWPMVGGTF